jgi:hypothetical protein
VATNLWAGLNFTEFANFSKDTDIVVDGQASDSAEPIRHRLPFCGSPPLWCVQAHETSHLPLAPDIPTSDLGELLWDGAAHRCVVQNLRCKITSA